MIFEVEYEPLYAIPDEERNIEKFTLLSRMNEFVIKLYRVEVTECKNEPEEINCQIIFSKRMSFDADDFIHENIFREP